jgi:hydrogen cyanide synthase HcnB
MGNKIVIVGGGPAGLSAATELATYGLKSVVIDEAPKLGGVIYRGPWRNTDSLPHLDGKLKSAIDSIQNDYKRHFGYINFLSSTRVLGPDGVNGLLVNSQDKLSVVNYDHLIIATGCQERSIPFPGWSLPGVMLLGGIQLQLKSGLVRPGKSVVITGTGPLILLVACQLHKAGCEVVGVCEAAKFSELSKEFFSMVNRPLQLLNGLSIMLYLKKTGILVKYGWGIVEARGMHNEVNEVVIAPYNEKWQPEKTKSVSLKADVLGVGYGFTARSQLGQLLGIKMSYDHLCGVIPETDEWQQSSKDDVYCAGDCAKIAGADAASVEGKITATVIASKLGKLSNIDAQAKIEKYRKTLRRFYDFRKAFDNISYRQLSLVDLADPETIVCRCENVKKKSIDKAIEEGCRDIVTIKMRTRITMGDCQGKTCSAYCYDLLEKESYSPDEILVRPRFPLDPIPFLSLKDKL